MAATFFCIRRKTLHAQQMQFLRNQTALFENLILEVQDAWFGRVGANNVHGSKARK